VAKKQGITVGIHVDVGGDQGCDAVVRKIAGYKYNVNSSYR